MKFDKLYQKNISSIVNFNFSGDKSDKARCLFSLSQSELYMSRLFSNKEVKTIQSNQILIKHEFIKVRNPNPQITKIDQMRIFPRFIELI